MTFEDQVAQAHNQREALLVIARALDALTTQTPHGEWSTWPAAETSVVLPPTPPPERDAEWLKMAQQVRDEDRAVTLIESEDNTEVVLPLVSAERYSSRITFEKQNLRIAEHLGSDEDWNKAYGLGGPLWLYLGNRDLVMSYPTHVKQAMIDDVAQDSQQDAHEMARDILKHPCETGPGGPAMQIAQGQIG